MFTHVLEVPLLQFGEQQRELERAGLGRIQFAGIGESTRGPAKQFSCNMRFGYTDKGFRLSLRQTGFQRFDADAGVNQYRYRAGFKQGEKKSKKIQPRCHHQGRSGAASNTVFGQAPGVII